MQEEEENTLYQKRKRLTLCSALLSLITEPPLSTPFFLSQRSGRKQKESKVQVSLRVAQAREERPVFAITSRVGGSERWVIRVSIHTVHFSLGRHIFIHHFPLSFFFSFSSSSSCSRLRSSAFLSLVSLSLVPLLTFCARQRRVARGATCAFRFLLPFLLLLLFSFDFGTSPSFRRRQMHSV